MIKKILSAALVAISLVAVPSIAQTSNSGKDSKMKPQRECVEKGCKFKERGGKIRANRYEGLNLTDAQKQQLAQLDSTQMELRRTKAQEWKARKQEQRLNKDAKIEKKELSKEEREAMAQERKMKKQEMAQERRAANEAERRDYLKQVKNIVGDQNYVLFLENEFVTVAPGEGRPDHNAFREGPRGENQKMMKHASKDGKKKDANLKDGKKKGDKNMKAENGRNMKAEKKNQKNS